MTSSFRIAAISATFFFLPEATRAFSYLVYGSATSRDRERLS